MSATKMAERPPFYHEARAYCEKFGINSIDECERVRLSMCAREFRERMKPWTDALVRVSGYGLKPTAELMASYREIEQQTAKDLGIELPTQPTEDKEG